LQQQKNEYLVR